LRSYLIDRFLKESGHEIMLSFRCGNSVVDCDCGGCLFSVDSGDCRREEDSSWLQGGPCRLRV